MQDRGKIPLQFTCTQTIMSIVTGEETHDKGRDGALRAKRWLEATTRANVPWINPDPVAIPKLRFPWIDPDSEPFSFDLGGMLIGGDVANQEFLAESKNYTNAGHQNTMYNEYLAKCYVARTLRPDRGENFMWITWAAFATTSWSELLTKDRVRKAVVAEPKRALAVESADAESMINDDLCGEVASRLWMIVLSERQERHLVLSAEHQGLIRKHVIEQDAANG
jgi:hypothetical protein